MRIGMWQTLGCETNCLGWRTAPTRRTMCALKEYSFDLAHVRMRFRMVMNAVFNWLKSRRVGFRHLAVDILVSFCALVAAVLLRLGTEGTYPLDAISFTAVAVTLLLARFGAMFAFGCYSVMWRYISTSDSVRLTQAVLVSSAVMIILTFMFPDNIARLPRSVYLIEASLAILGLMGARLARRLLYEGRAVKQTKIGKRALIYGAGQNGRHLAQRFRADAALGIHVVGFIDDDNAKSDLVIGGVPVLGDRKSLSRVIDQFAISEVIVAIPELEGGFLRDLVVATRPFNIKPRIIAKLEVGVAQKSPRDVEIIREVELTDLLNHPPRAVDLESVKDLIGGRCILVTGAGGSIGSELCRQIMKFGPRRLLLLDHAEFNLYEVDRELRLATHDMERVIPLLVDLKDTESLSQILRKFSPEIVFHAAAYKHVHLVESNPFSAILNNVEGTRNLLQLCEQIGVTNFIMISTDKAVNPAGVMGATKRVCELMVTEAARRAGKSYCCVRFGNVLGSSGSLIPLLKEQIESGGPVTITHPEMTRFFMLIPEAVALVLKASTISNPGDISVLKMGEPVKILDVAKSLMMLMGKSEDEVPIIFTGIRPGEKIFEELYIRGDEIATEHPDILTIPFGDTDGSDAEFLGLNLKIDKLVNQARIASDEALNSLSELVKSNGAGKVETHQDNGRVLNLAPRRDH